MTEATTIPGPCQVTGLGAEPIPGRLSDKHMKDIYSLDGGGTGDAWAACVEGRSIKRFRVASFRGELYLDAPVTIRGDSSFLGQVSVKATRQTERLYHATMDGPCLTITGSFILHPGARLHFESCQNGQSTSEGSLGGGLRVDADMDLRGGHLRFENCRADGDEIITGAGGAIYVGGARAPKAAPKARLLTCGGHFRNKNSTIEACNCSGTTGGAPKKSLAHGCQKITSSKHTIECFNVPFARFGTF